MHLEEGNAVMGAAEVEGLTDRWARARRAALGVSADAEIAPVLEAAAPAQKAELLRKLFDNSLRLGQSFVKFRREAVSGEQLAEVLPRLGSPCVCGQWSEVDGEAALRVERAPCREDASAELCDGWREAIDGLVLGVTGSVRHTRHRSRGHGDLTCVDIVYADPESRLRYGTLPPELAGGLESVSRLVGRFNAGVQIEFLGVSEGVLLYTLTAARSTGCGGFGVRTLRQIVERALSKHFPKLTLREVSPRPVLEPGSDAENSNREETTHD